MTKPPSIKPLGNARHNWSRPFALTTQPGNWPDEPGIYRLRLKVHSEFVSIHRICKDDPDGILYIGRAKADEGLSYRLEELRKAWTDTAVRHLHGSAERFFRNRHLTLQHPSPDVVVEYKTMRRFRGKGKEWRAADLPTDAIADDAAVIEERSALWAYEQEFGELPPLNARGGDHLK